MMNILIIGNFGYVNSNIGGQTIKTRNILELYSVKRKDDNIDFFDVDTLYSNKIRIFKLFTLIKNSEELILIPGQKFLKLLFPLIMTINKFLNKKILVFAVGGWLDNYLMNNRSVLRSIKNVKTIFVESRALKNALAQNYGLSNVVTFPNFRITDFNKKSLIKEEVFRIIFMARITEVKGVDILFDLMNYIESHKNKLLKKVTLTFCGPIDSNYKTRFYDKLDSSSNCVYDGVIQPDKVYEKLNQQDICILPTFHKGEGFPGTIVDSYIAGIPVIVSNWKNLPEFVENNYSGFVFDLDRFDNLCNIVVECVNNPSILKQMKSNARKTSQKFSADMAWKIIKTVQ